MFIPTDALIGFLILTAIVVTVWSVHLKDTYYGYGEMNALQNQCGNLIEYEDGVMSLEVSERYVETYIGHLADSVYKLMIKNGLGYKFKVMPKPEVLSST